MANVAPSIDAMRTFHLERTEDVNGVSGLGRVAEGVEFTDGTCVLRWLSHSPSTNIYPNTKQLDTVHGHGGRTKIVWHNVGEPMPPRGA